MQAIGEHALTVNLFFGTLVFAAAAKIYLLPKLTEGDPRPFWCRSCCFIRNGTSV
jgi:hypothetical protein